MYFEQQTFRKYTAPMHLLFVYLQLSDLEQLDVTPTYARRHFGRDPHAPSQPSNESLLPLHLRGGSVMILRGYEGQSHRTPSDQVVLPSKAQNAQTKSRSLTLPGGWEHHSLEPENLHSLSPQSSEKNGSQHP